MSPDSLPYTLDDDDRARILGLVSEATPSESQSQGQSQAAERGPRASAPKSDYGGSSLGAHLHDHQQELAIGDDRQYRLPVSSQSQPRQGYGHVYSQSIGPTQATQEDSASFKEVLDQAPVERRDHSYIENIFDEPPRSPDLGTLPNGERTLADPVSTLPDAHIGASDDDAHAIFTTPAVEKQSSSVQDADHGFIEPSLPSQRPPTTSEPTSSRPAALGAVYVPMKASQDRRMTMATAGSSQDDDPDFPAIRRARPTADQYAPPRPPIGARQATMPTLRDTPMVPFEDISTIPASAPPPTSGDTTDGTSRPAEIIVRSASPPMRPSSPVKAEATQATAVSSISEGDTASVPLRRPFAQTQVAATPARPRHDSPADDLMAEDSPDSVSMTPAPQLRGMGVRSAATDSVSVARRSQRIGRRPRPGVVPDTPAFDTGGGIVLELATTPTARPRPEVIEITSHDVRPTKRKRLALDAESSRSPTLDATASVEEIHVSKKQGEECQRTSSQSTSSSLTSLFSEDFARPDGSSTSQPEQLQLQLPARIEGLDRRVLAFDTGSKAFYPALLMGYTKLDQDLRLQIRFDDATDRTVPVNAVRPLRLEAGQTVRVSVKSIKNKDLEIVELTSRPDDTVEGNPPAPDIDGHTSLVGRRKDNGSVDTYPVWQICIPQKLAKPFLAVPPFSEERLACMFGTSAQDLQRQGRFSIEPATPSRRARAQLMELLRGNMHSPARSHKSVDFERGNGTTAALPYASTDQPAIALETLPRKSDLFAGLAFTLTLNGDSGEIKHHAATIIASHGGIVLREGLEELFSPLLTSKLPEGGVARTAELQLSPLRGREELKCAVCLAHAPSRKAKYLQALALGLPCLHLGWIAACLRARRIVDWRPYLLAAGEASLPSIDPDIDPWDANTTPGAATPPAAEHDVEHDIVLVSMTAPLRIHPTFDGSTSATPAKVRSRTSTGGASSSMARILADRPRVYAGRSVLVVLGESLKEQSRRSTHVFLARALGADNVGVCRSWRDFLSTIAARHKVLQAKAIEAVTEADADADADAGAVRWDTLSVSYVDDELMSAVAALNNPSPPAADGRTSKRKRASRPSAVNTNGSGSGRRRRSTAVADVDDEITLHQPHAVGKAVGELALRRLSIVSNEDVVQSCITGLFRCSSGG